MTLSDLAALGSFVSGVAVVFSFVFLGLQIRQSDRNQRAVLNAQSNSAFNEHMLKWTEPHLAALWWRMMEGETDFNGPEFMQVLGMVSALLNDYSDLDAQRRLGFSDLESDEGIKQGVANLMAFPFARALWLMSEPTFPPSFRAQVNAIIRDTPLQPVDWLAIVKTNVEKVRRDAANSGR